MGLKSRFAWVRHRDGTSGQAPLVRRFVTCLVIVSGLMSVLALLAASLAYTSDQSLVGRSLLQSSSSSSSMVVDHDSDDDHSEASAHGVEIIPGLNGNECDAKWEGQWYANVVYVFLAFYTFIGVAIICDGHFTSALEAICSERGLDLSENVAGATFMAAGSSAPELASSFLGTFVSKSDVGIGTILGSAVFNILIIIGLTAILAGKALKLDYRPLVRDNMFYMMSVIILLVVVGDDSKVNWVEGLAMLLFYTFYILFLWKDDQINQQLAATANSVKQRASVMLGRQPSKQATLETKASRRRSVDEGTQTKDAALTVEERGGEQKIKKAASAEPKDVTIEMGDITIHAEDGDKTVITDTPLHDEENLDDEPIGHTMRQLSRQNTGLEPQTKNCCSTVSAGVDKLFEGLAWPYEFVFNLTIPNCEIPDADEEKKDDNKDEAKSASTQTGPVELTFGQKHYMVTFTMSVFWIAILSYFMVLFMEKLGCIWGLSAATMGLTFLAAGTSVPDSLGSIAVAREGKGDMAVSNAIGSNVFDICIGLGLPWLINAIAGNDNAITETEEIVPSVIVLLAIVVVLFSVMGVTKFKLYPPVGYVLLLVYVAFVLYQLLK